MRWLDQRLVMPDPDALYTCQRRSHPPDPWITNKFVHTFVRIRKPQALCKYPRVKSVWIHLIRQKIYGTT